MVQQKQYEEEVHERQVESLKRQILAVKERLRTFVEPHKKLLGELRELEERFSEKVEINQRIEAELAKFETMVNDDVRSRYSWNRGGLHSSIGSLIATTEQGGHCHVALVVDSQREPQEARGAVPRELQGTDGCSQCPHRATQDARVRVSLSPRSLSL